MDNLKLLASEFMELVDLAHEYSEIGTSYACNRNVELAFLRERNSVA